ECDTKRDEVTNATAIESGSPIAWSNIPGTLNLADLLVQSLTDPDHALNLEYEGYTVQLEIDILNDLVDLSSLPIVNALLQGDLTELEVGTRLPAALLTLSGAPVPVQLLVPEENLLLD